MLQKLLSTKTKTELVATTTTNRVQLELANSNSVISNSPLFHTQSHFPRQFAPQSFESFHWLGRYHELWAITFHGHALQTYGKRTHNFLGRFLSYSSFIFYILGAFLIKQLFHSCAGWIWDDYSRLSARRLIGSLPSHIQRAFVAVE